MSLLSSVDGWEMEWNRAGCFLASSKYARIYLVNLSLGESLGSSK